jgi:hypothetical protein
VLRAGLLAVASCGLTTAAHGLAGGAAPDTGLSVLITLLVAAAGTALADRRRGPLAIGGALAVSQLGQHLVLSSAGHQHAAALPGVGLGGTAMTVAHALAGLATAGLLCWAESAFFALVAALALVLPRRVGGRPAVARLRVLVAPGVRVDVLRGVLLRVVCGRRGPPVAGLVLGL